MTLFTKSKTVERAIRSSDIRQLITYAALNYASQQYAIDKIGIFNPDAVMACEVNQSTPATRYLAAQR